MCASLSFTRSENSAHLQVLFFSFFQVPRSESNLEMLGGSTKAIILFPPPHSVLLMADGICTQERRKSNRRLTPHPDPLGERWKVYTAYICY